ncbi:MAG: cell wall-active antibiotics response protein [Ignavibacteriales bacterium]|jgi:predicted membrane protein|nr:LiaF-related protein [Ignavibacteriaceae bacterium]NLH61258.1 cell wall-active antibiotics response protein [Ignavibacteriales bacterium]HOJ17235.1 LiaF-related protein [Ignavibacteriaceae bacterium]HPO54424.1 LiaF-related protein [Ignavibacteriaceae bacterium]
MEKSKVPYVRIIIGLVLLFLGVYFLGVNFNLFDYRLPPHLLSFPTLVILLGIIIIFNSNRLGFGLAVVLFGALWLAAKFVPGIDFRDVVFPFIIITIGFSLLFKSKDGGRKYFNPFHKKEQTEYSKDKISDVAIFGGANKQFTSSNFQGGEITAIFGGSEIDLTDCKLAPGEQTIDVLFCFGGSTLIVPRNWNIVINVTPLFGGFSHKNKRYINPNEVYEGTLIIKGIAVFGGGEIKSY